MAVDESPSAPASYGQSYRSADEYGGWRPQDSYAQDRYGESTSGIVGKARDGISEAVGQVQRTGSELAARARDGVSNALGDGCDVRELSLLERKERLRTIIDGVSRVHYVDHLEAQARRYSPRCASWAWRAS